MRRQTEFIWGLIVLALVAWWAARTSGVLPIGLDDFIQRALPALLVIVGLTLLLRRRIPLYGVIALLLTVVLVGAVGYSAYSSRATQQRTDTQQSIAQEVDTNLSLLRIRVSALDTDVELLGSPAQGIVNGTFSGSADNAVAIDYQESGDGSATLVLRESRQSGDFPVLETVGRGVLKLNLPPSIPMDIEFESADGSIVLNMSGVDLERLNVTARHGDLVVTLPDYNPEYSQPEDTLGTLSALDGDLAIFVPARVSAQLDLAARSQLPQFNVDRYYLVNSDTALVAKDLTTADNGIRFTLSVPRGVIRVEESA